MKRDTGSSPYSVSPEGRSLSPGVEVIRRVDRLVLSSDRNVQDTEFHEDVAIDRSRGSLVDMYG